MAVPALPKPEMANVRIQVDAETHRIVEEYARFLGGATTPAYIYAYAARKAALSDKPFLKARGGKGDRA